MSVQHNDVTTVCTASHLTGWSINGLDSDDPATVLNTKIKTVEELINMGYHRDFALLEIIITDRQRTRYRLDDFLPKIGFKLVFEGDKDASGQRHKESGNLTMWCARPTDYQSSLEAYRKELRDEKDRRFPPKKPDPKRLAIENLLLSKLRKAKMVQDNSSVQNPIEQVLLVAPDVFARHIQMKFGMDVTALKTPKGWTKLTIKQLKDAHVAWQNELF